MRWKGILTDYGLNVCAGLNNRTFKITRATCSRAKSDDPTKVNESEDYITDLDIIDVTNRDKKMNIKLRFDNISVTESDEIKQIEIWAKSYIGNDVNPDEKGNVFLVVQAKDMDAIRPIYEGRYVKEYNFSIMNVEADNIQLNVSESAVVTYKEFSEILPNKYITTISHNLGKYPIGELTKGEYLLGMQRAGEGGAGGSNLVQVPLKLVHKSKNIVDVYSSLDVNGIGKVKEVINDNGLFYIIFENSNESLVLILE